MSKARDLSNFISDATVDASEIADLAVTHAKLHTDMNLSSKTLTFAANQISGNAIDGGVISNFASTGIDDNSSATAVTILSGGNVGIGASSPSTKLHVDGGGSSPEIRIAQNSTYYTDIGINHIDVAGNDLRIMMGGSEKWRFKSGGDLYASGAQEVKSGDKSSVGYEAFFGANSLRFNRDGDSYIDTRGTNNNLKFRHNSNYDTAMTILGSNGNVGIGTTSPSVNLEVSDSGNSFILVKNTSSGSGLYIKADTDGDAEIQTAGGNNNLVMRTSGQERVRIDADGRKILGHNAALTLGNDNSYFQVIGSGSNDANITIARFQSSNYGPYLNIVKSRSGTKGSFSRLNNNDYVGGINWYGDDGNDANTAVATIEVQMDGDTGSNDMPGRIMFRTTPDGSNATVERMRIDNAGKVSIGQASVNGMQLSVSSQSYLGGIVVGQVLDSINNNSEALLMHRLDSSGVGFQFSGEVYCNSWTGQAHVNFNAVAKYTNDAVSWFINGNGVGGTVSKVQLRLATISYASGTYLAVIKDGGGTGVFYINGFLGTNMQSYGGLRAVASGQYTVTTTHANLN